MSLNNNLEIIEKLNKQINEYGILNNDVKKQINYRFRLDWNYNSNAIEGGTLTPQETRTVMIGNINIGNKSIRDVFEMKGHDDVITEILEIGKGNKKISEKRIKEIHKLIIKDDDKENFHLIGEWKKYGNHIINYQNEKHSFAAPNEVAEKIHNLIDVTNSQIDSLKTKNPKNNPVIIALKFHLEFVNIHPFYDGNGRMSRILSNLILISLGYPPYIVAKKDKDRYNKLIGDIQCYGGKEDLFFEFLTELIINSQKIVIQAIEGKDISPIDNFEKQLALIDNEFSENKEVEIKRSNTAIKVLYNNSFKNLFNSIEARLSILDGRFDINEKVYTLEPKIGIEEDEKNRVDLEGLENQIFFNFSEPKKYGHAQNYNYPVNIERPIINRISAAYHWNGFKKAGLKAFNISSYIVISFLEYGYAISDNINNSSPWLEKLYDEELSETDIETILKTIEEEVIDNIKSKVKILKKE